MRVKDSNGRYHSPKNTDHDWHMQEYVLQQTRLLSGHHPDTGEKMTPEQIQCWNEATKTGQTHE